MKTRTKSVIAISGTLIIGMVIGALIAFQIVRKRIQNFRELHKRSAFTEHILEAADPDPDQRTQIKPFLDDFGTRMEQLHKEHAQELRGEMQALKDSLQLHLDESQMQSVERRLKRLRGGMKGRRKFRHGPPPPQP